MNQGRIITKKREPKLVQHDHERSSSFVLLPPDKYKRVDKIKRIMWNGNYTRVEVGSIRSHILL